MAGANTARLTFRPRHRLAHARQFESVYGAKMRKSSGGVVLFTRPNGLDHPRLGLAVGRSAGAAVARNRIKRLVREVFRSRQHDWPRTDAGCYDMVVSVRGGNEPGLEQVRAVLTELAEASHREWMKRAAKAGGGP